MATSFSGTHGMNVFTATVLASALRFYGKTGMRVNRAYTPTAMLSKASELTGLKFKRGQFAEAAAALDAFAQLEAALARPGEIQ